MKAKVGVPLVICALALATALLGAKKSSAPDPEARPDERPSVVRAASRGADVAKDEAVDDARKARGLARALNAAADVYRQAEAERLADVQAVVAQNQATVPDGPAQMAPPTRALNAEELEQREKVDSVFATAGDRSPQPVPKPEALQAILAEIARTDDPSVRRGLSGAYRDMIAGLPPEDMAAAIEGLEKARARTAAPNP